MMVGVCMSVGTAESSYLKLQAGGREHTGIGMSLLKTQSSSPLTQSPPTKPHFLILSK